jgi:hypothetical protein
MSNKNKELTKYTPGQLVRHRSQESWQAIETRIATVEQLLGQAIEGLQPGALGRIAAVLERAAGVQEWLLAPWPSGDSGHDREMGPPCPSCGCQLVMVSAADEQRTCPGCGADRSGGPPTSSPAEDDTMGQLRRLGLHGLADAEQRRLAWIPVAERLPAAEGYVVAAHVTRNVLVWVDDFAGCLTAAYDHEHAEWIDGSTDEGLRLTGVTHWQPLPSPPSADGDASAEPASTPDPPAETSPQDWTQLARDRVPPPEGVVCHVGVPTRMPSDHRVPCSQPATGWIWCDTEPTPACAEHLASPPPGATTEPEPVADDGAGATVIGEPPPATAADPLWRLLLEHIPPAGNGTLAVLAREAAPSDGCISIYPGSLAASYPCDCGRRHLVRTTWTPTPAAHGHLSPSYEDGPGSPIRVTSDRAPQLGDRVDTPHGEGTVLRMCHDHYIVRVPALREAFPGGECMFSADELTVIRTPAAESPPEPAAPLVDPQPTPEPETPAAADVEPPRGPAADLAPGDTVELPGGGRGVVLDVDPKRADPRYVEVLPFEYFCMVDGYASGYRPDELRRVS